MDRRRKSVAVEGTGKKRGLMLPPIGKKDFHPAVMNMRKPSILGVTDSNPTVKESVVALNIDPNLLVGPVYDNTKQRQMAIKDQLGDITQRLHRTLNEFDVMYDNVEQPDDVLRGITNRINDIENDDTKHHFKNFINQYRDMSDEFHEANKEREELMYSLADWFTMDHLDLDDKLSMNETEESNMTNDYANAQMNFEKIKRLQAEILKANIQGKNPKSLIDEKKRIEKNVMGNIRTLRERGNSVSEKSSKPPDDSPWKYCADEIVGLLRKVRTDTSEEMEHLTKRLREMIKAGEEQSRTIQALQKELKEKKNIINVFADENTDLTKEVTTLRDKMDKYETELDQATKMLERHFALSLMRKDGVEDDVINQMNTPKLTMSKVFKDLQTDDDAEAQKVKRLSSDPVMLRTQLREAKERIHELIELLTDTNDKVESMEREMEEKDAKINELLKDVSAIQDQLDVKLEEESKPKPVLSVTGLPVKMTSHVCIKCKFSLSRSEISISRIPSVVPTITEGKEMTSEEATKLTKKIHFYKNALADTELNLSNAYKEISVLRRKCMEDGDEESVTVKSNKVVITSFTISSSSSSSSSSCEEVIIEPTKAINMLGVTTAVSSGKSATAVTMKDGVVKKGKRKKKQFERVPSHRGPIDLPPQEVPPPDMELQAIPAPKGTREHTLWAVGDLQGKLNQLANNVMAFIQEVANVIIEEHTKKFPTKETAAKPAAKQFEFGNTPAGGKMGALSKLGEKAESETQQKKAMVLTSGQRAVALIREAYDMLSKSLNLGHDEYEIIYRSYKRHQQIRAYQQPHVQNPNGDYGRRVNMGNDANSYEYYLRSLQRSQSKSKVANPITYRRDSRYDMYHGDQYLHDSNSSIGSTESAHARRRLKGTVMVMGMKRSRTDLDMGSFGSLDGRTDSMLRLTRERSQVFLVNMPNYGQRYRETTEVNREEAQIGTAKIPKKGMLKLTSLEQEIANPNLFDKHPDEEEKPQKRKSLASNVKGLIKRKDIIKQLQLGAQKLEQEQEMEENMQEESLENYTMGDLQKNIMNFAEKTRRGNRKASLVKPGSIVLKAMENQHRQAAIPEERKTGKAIGLPSINFMANFK